MLTRDRLRWLAVMVFALSSAVNFMDRQLLSALAPELKAEFLLSNEQYGLVVTAFSLPYALMSPLAGLLIDRVGLKSGSSLALAFWSLAGIATGFARGLAGLLFCRAWLGIAESAGIPGTGKASAVYLYPKERALGSAISQIGLTLGFVSAPFIAALMSHAYGWRSAFVVCGALGFLWIPLWLYTARRAPRAEDPQASPPLPVRDIITDRRLWYLMFGNMMQMTIYSLWVNWTTLFLVETHGLSQTQANVQLAWIPPIFATAGGLTGGWLSMRWSQSLGDVKRARLRAMLLSVLLTTATAAVPFLPSPGWATAAICVSYFGCLVGSVNLYSAPLDIFGAGRAAFAVSALTCSYGLLQSVQSPAIGWLVDQFSYKPVCLLAALLPFGAYGFMRASSK